MIIVSGHITIRAGKRPAFLKASQEAMKSARAAPGCRDFIVSADPIEEDRVNVYEEWDSQKAMLAFRGDGPDSGMTEMIVDANVRRHSVRKSGPA